MGWDPEQYLKFKAERYRPFDDCLQLIPRRPALRVIDLGCGTGELTRRLADALDAREVLGIDSSTEMLDKAQKEAWPGLHFEQRRIEDAVGATAQKWDLVFSHAAIHWVDDHAALIPRLLSLCEPEGQLVVQLPSNHQHVSHQLILEVASLPRFADALAGFQRQTPVLSVGEYADRLWAAGGRELTVFEKVYPHVLPDADAVAEWTRGTTLVPYLERLPEHEREPFLDEYRTRLRRAMPGAPVFYGFRRILFSARRLDVNPDRVPHLRA